MFRSIATICLGPTTVLVIFAMLGNAAALSQDIKEQGDQATENSQEQQTDETAQAETAPKLKAYQEILKNLKRIEDQTAQIMRSIPVGDVQRRLEMMAAVDQLTARKQQLLDSLPAAAVDAFLEAPDANQNVTDHVVYLVRDALGMTINAQKYDPQYAYDVSVKLCANGTTNKSLVFTAGQAAYALERFDEAEQYLKQLKELGAEVPEATFEVIAKKKEGWQRELAQRSIDEGAQLPRVLLKTTEGDILLELFEDQAPNTVCRFIELVEKKFYDQLIFFVHKPGSLSTTGCRRGDGSTAIDYFIPDECNLEGARQHFVGSLSMQTAGPNTASCQFSIVHQPNADRDGKFTVFGRVIEGMDVVFRMAAMEPQLRFTKRSTQITSATVVRKRTHGYEVKDKIPFDVEPLIPVDSADDSGGAADGAAENSGNRGGGGGLGGGR